MFATIASRRAPVFARALRATTTKRAISSMIEPAKYTATALATGAGRNGTVSVTSDVHSPLDVPITLAMPRSLGGTGEGSNPEQLFAAGYAACFLGAVQAVGRNAGKDVKDATVNVKAHLGASEGIPGFALSVEIEVSGVKDEELVKMAHELCPYSRALQQGAKTVARLV